MLGVVPVLPRWRLARAERSVINWQKSEAIIAGLCSSNRTISYQQLSPDQVFQQYNHVVLGTDHALPNIPLGKNYQQCWYSCLRSSELAELTALVV